MVDINRVCPLWGIAPAVGSAGRVPQRFPQAAGLVSACVSEAWDLKTAIEGARLLEPLKPGGPSSGAGPWSQHFASCPLRPRWLEEPIRWEAFSWGVKSMGPFGPFPRGQGALSLQFRPPLAFNLRLSLDQDDRRGLALLSKRPGVES